MKESVYDICNNIYDSPMESNVRKRVLALIDRLESLKQDLEKIHYVNNEPAFFEKMWEVRSFFITFSDAEVFDIFHHTQEFIAYRTFFFEANVYFERALDSAEALNILAKDASKDLLDLVSNGFSKNVFLQTHDEINAVSSGDINTLVMVGCGPAPETILYISENTNIKKIIGIDNDAEAIFMAGRVMKKMGLEKKVFLCQKNGQDFDYSQADCIHMANFLQGKKEILDQISKTAPSGCKIIVRKAEELTKLVYESIYLDLHTQLILKDTLPGAMFRFHVLEKFNFDVQDEDQNMNTLSA